MIVPPLEDEPWPTLGPGVCDFIENALVYGPGDVLGRPVTLTDEQRLVIYRAYEVFPKGHARAGRRRFKRVGLSRRKGWSKTELAAWLAICETHPEGPVRTVGWSSDNGGEVPIGGPVTDPYVPMVAVTEEQTEDLAYGAVRAILTEPTCAVADDFVVGLERTLVAHGRGEIKPLASAPSAREGARTTFQHFDETHLFVSPRLLEAHRVMMRNIPKRLAADAWSLETTTAYAPNEGSVAEDTHLHAEKVATGELEDTDLYFDHKQASEEWDISKADELEHAVMEASGDAWAFTDIEAIKQLFRSQPEYEVRRYYLNQPRASLDRWIMPMVWDAAAEPRELTPNESVTLGFWGGVNRDSAGLVACTSDGYVTVLGSWEPRGLRVATSEVEAAITDAVDTYDVLELATSRTGGSGWITEIEAWHDEFGFVTEIPVNSPARMAPACDRVYTAVHDGALKHDGNPTLARHVANCQPAKSVHGTYIRGEHITLARAAVLAYERAMHETNVEVNIMVV